MMGFPGDSDCKESSRPCSPVLLKLRTGEERGMGSPGFMLKEGAFLLHVRGFPLLTLDSLVDSKPR